MLHLSEYQYEEGSAVNLRVIDKWLLSKLNKLILSVTDAMENYKFDEAMKDIRIFAWNVLADDYIELVKSRLYGRSGDEGKESAKYALYETLQTLSKLLAPFIPFYAEEMYSYIEPGKSVHNEYWPEVKRDRINAEAEMEGDLIADITRAVRRYKSEQGIPLNAPLRKLEIYVEDLDTWDMENATATKVEFCNDVSKIENDENTLDVNGTKVRIIKE
jgi:valyl-tRNA synthetase